MAFFFSPVSSYPAERRRCPPPAALAGLLRPTFHLKKLFLQRTSGLLLFDVLLIVKHGIHLFRSTGGFTQMPGWDLNVTVGGNISYPSLKGGKKKKIRDQGNVNAPSPHLRAERNLHSGCHLHPHMSRFWEKQSARLPSQIVWNLAKEFGKEARWCCGRGLPQTPFGSYTMHDLADEVRRSGLGGSEQISQREVKLDGRRCIRAKTRNPQLVLQNVSENGNSVRLSAAAWERLSAAAVFAEPTWGTPLHSNKSWEKRLHPRSIPQTGVSTPHKHSGSSSSHWSRHFL